MAPRQAAPQTSPAMTTVLPAPITDRSRVAPPPIPMVTQPSNADADPATRACPASAKAPSAGTENPIPIDMQTTVGRIIHKLWMPLLISHSNASEPLATNNPPSAASRDARNAALRASSQVTPTYPAAVVRPRQP